jgi:hypothetical protein
MAHREDARNEAAILARLLHEKLDLVPEQPLVYPVLCLGRICFTLNKRLSDFGPGYDYDIVATVTASTDPAWQTRAVVIKNLADLGAVFTLANSL